MTALLLLIGLLLLLANAVFVAAEFALVAARRSRMQELAAQGDGRARAVLAAMGRPASHAGRDAARHPMASIGLGFTVEATVEASLVPALEHALPLPDALLPVASAALALGTVVAAHTVLGEMVAKNLSVASPERSAIWLGPLIGPFAVAVRPAVLMLSGLASALLRALRVEPRSELAAHGMEEIGDMMRLAGREGAIDPAERELLERALRFAGMEVKDVMVPWDQVTLVSAGTPAAEAERLLDRLRPLAAARAEGWRGPGLCQRTRPAEASDRAAASSCAAGLAVKPPGGGVRRSVARREGGSRSSWETRAIRSHRDSGGPPAGAVSSTSG